LLGAAVILMGRVSFNRRGPAIPQNPIMPLRILARARGLVKR